MNIKTLTCCCCGARCKGRQWWNRDTGYGLCGKCAAWIRARGKESPEEMERAYGKPGIYYFELGQVPA